MRGCTIDREPEGQWPGHGDQQRIDKKKGSASRHDVFTLPLGEAITDCADQEKRLIRDGNLKGVDAALQWSDSGTAHIDENDESDRVERSLIGPYTRRCDNKEIGFVRV
jgi:hypothetical protein